MKRRIIKTAAICLIVAAVGAGGVYAYNRFFVKKTAAATGKYYTVSVTKMNITSSVSGTGSAYAGTIKNVSANNNGTLEGFAVKVGDSVKKGQKLFTASSDELSENVTAAKNNLTKANLSLTTDESGEMVDENKVAADKIAVSEAKAQLAKAKEALADITVYAPIAGIVTAVNNANGDGVQSGGAVLTIQDIGSMKIKVSVDELDISKVKAGQEASVTFDAIANKTYKGTVETVAPTGTASNNVTNYDVVVSLSAPSGIKLGMNGDVTIKVESKENALVVPAEAVVESSGKTYVRVASSEGTASQSGAAQQSNTSANGDTAAQGSGTAQSGTASQGSSGGQSGAKSGTRLTSASFKLVEIETGIETQDYIEVTKGLSEGQQIIVKLPSTNTSTTNDRGGFGEMGGMQGEMPGGGMQGPSNSGGNRTGGNGPGSQNQK